MGSQEFEEWYKQKYGPKIQTDWLDKSTMSSDMSAPAQPEPIAGAKPESSGTAQGAMAAGQTAAQGGNALDTVSSGLMMSGNTKAMAAGLALQTVNQVNKQKQEREQNRYLAEVQRVKARQDAIDRLASIGQNLRA